MSDCGEASTILRELRDLREERKDTVTKINEIYIDVRLIKSDLYTNGTEGVITKVGRLENYVYLFIGGGTLAAFTLGIIAKAVF